MCVDTGHEADPELEWLSKQASQDIRYPVVSVVNVFWKWTEHDVDTEWFERSQLGGKKKMKDQVMGTNSTVGMGGKNKHNRKEGKTGGWERVRDGQIRGDTKIEIAGERRRTREIDGIKRDKKEKRQRKSKRDKENERDGERGGERDREGLISVLQEA